MKTYLLHSIDKYKRFSDQLEVKAIVCNKSWRIFNEAGDKEVYIFQDDGGLIVSINGEITDASWSYIAANKSIRISTAEKSYMLKPFFMDDVIFSLQLDGTDQYTFMIDENKAQNLLIDTLNDVLARIEERQRLSTIEESKFVDKLELKDSDLLLQEAIKKDSNYQQLESRTSKHVHLMMLSLIIGVFAFVRIFALWGDENVGGILIACIIATLFCLFLIIYLNSKMNKLRSLKDGIIKYHKQEIERQQKK